MKLYSNITILFCIWILSVLIVFYSGFFLFPNNGSVSVNFIERLGNWDGGHYINIAKLGYIDNSQYAFFPLYPLLIKLVSQITGSYLIAGLFISITSSFFAMHLLFKLVSQDFGKSIGTKTVVAFLIFPTSFFLLTTYSEGLFLLLVVLTFYFLRQKKLVLATIICALASATRLAGLAIFLALLFEVQISSGINRKNWYVLFGALGFILYCFYLYTKTSDPFYFITAEASWQRFITVPGFSFWETIKTLVNNGFLNKDYFNAFLELTFSIFGLGMSLRVFRFLPASYGIYALISILLPIFSSLLTSIPRFILPIFPIFILLAFSKNQNVLFFYQLISIMLLSVFSILYINGYWVS